MMSSLQLGNRLFSNSLIQGPLAGYSCAPFRLLASQYGKPAFCVTEMISAHDLVQRPKQKNRFTTIFPKEGPVCFQLAGRDPKILGQATRIASDLGAALIDLNCGCPKPKIRCKGAGSRLLETPQLLGDIVASMHANTTLPLSVKIRIDDNCLLTAKTIADAGADCIIVHGRHWQQDYDVPCDYQQIENIVKAVTIPVIGNGDVNDKTSFEKMMTTGCAGVMISRASMGKPWLFAELIQDNSFKLPTMQERGEMLLQHIAGLITLENEYIALLQARSISKYYFRERYENDVKWRERLFGCENFEDFKTAIYRYN